MVAEYDLWTEPMLPLICILFCLTKFNQSSGAGLVRGGGGGADALFHSGIRPPADPKGPALVLFKKPIFGRPTL